MVHSCAMFTLYCYGMAYSLLFKTMPLLVTSLKLVFDTTVELLNDQIVFYIDSDVFFCVLFFF